MVGFVLLVLTLLLSFNRYLLPWDQLAIWAITVGSNMARATPFLGHEGPEQACSRSAILRSFMRAMTHDSTARRTLCRGGALLPVSMFCTALLFPSLPAC